MIIRAILVSLCLSATFAFAQDANHSHMKNLDHSSMMGSLEPRETGQSAFAAIQEIVTILNADKATDWSKVNIEALRQHLVDMNDVTLATTVELVDQGNSLKFIVTGKGTVRDSIRRMIIAHAATMNGVDGWGFLGEPTLEGAELTVSPPNTDAKTKLRGLGFIGIMSIGMHHQQHHLMIARGLEPHH